MATNFPGSLDGYTTKVDNEDDVLAAHVNNLQDAVTALQTKVGSDSSNISASIDYFLKNGSGTFKTHTHNGTNSAKISLLNLHESDIPSLAQGDLLYYDGSNLVKLPKATSGHLLRSGDTPVWAEELLSTDGTFAENSDVLYPSQKATKTYLDTKVGMDSRFFAWRYTGDEQTNGMENDEYYDRELQGLHTTNDDFITDGWLRLPPGTYYIEASALAYGLLYTSMYVKCYTVSGGFQRLTTPTGFPVASPSVASPDNENVIVHNSGFFVVPEGDTGTIGVSQLRGKWGYWGFNAYAGQGGHHSGTTASWYVMVQGTKIA